MIGVGVIDNKEIEPFCISFELDAQEILRLHNVGGSRISGIPDWILLMVGVRYIQTSADSIRLRVPRLPDDDSADLIGVPFLGVSDDSPQILLSEGHPTTRGDYTYSHPAPGTPYATRPD